MNDVFRIKLTPRLIIYCRKLVTILLTMTTAAQNVDSLTYHIVRGLYFLAVVFVATIKF